MYYLLGLWSRLVTSVPYLKGDAPSLLDEFVPKITEGFITSRFDSIQVAYRCGHYVLLLLLIKRYRLLTSKCTAQAGFPDDPSENPLDNVELLQDQLDCFPYLCRFQVLKSFFLFLNFYMFSIV